MLGCTTTFVFVCATLMVEHARAQTHSQLACLIVLGSSCTSLGHNPNIQPKVVSLTTMQHVVVHERILV
jgi:hypothetical protein